MKLERGVLEVLFNDISPLYVIDYLSKIHFKKDRLIDFKGFYRSGVNRFQNYSMDEIEKIYSGLENKLQYDDPGSFFAYLGNFCGTLLTYNEYEPMIKYEMLMRWNKISHILGQDLLTMSFLAYHDYQYSDWTKFFGYKSIISTDNRQLHNILDNGLAENHFHLKGSTQVFTLNWLSLMNHPTHRNDEFKQFSVKLNPYYRFIKSKDYDLYDLIKIAAILRLYFFKRTTNFSLVKNGKKEKYIIDNALKYIDQCIKNQNKIELFNEMFKSLNIITQQIHFSNNISLDYALLGDVDVKNKNNNYILVGERKLIYTAIYMMLDNQFTLLEKQYFYLYILIKNAFRRELIQVNNLYGFSNFSDYEKRKETFIDNYPEYKTALIKMAITNTFDGQRLDSLELRITPKKSALENEKYIQYVDNLMCDYVDKTCYIFHFVKRKDKEIYGDTIFYYRNYFVRKNVEYQAKCLAKALEENNYFRKRVKGIDACNNEYFCRPEVFGQVFRFLSNFHVKDSNKGKQVPIDIYKTYHVGEDFLDIADGLRAIDEAILFLDLRYGSRIGHATALGIDVKEYYEKKDRLIMTKQDFIDNIAWLFGKAKELNIDLSEYPCFEELKTEFYKVFDQIYAHCDYTIDEYYDAWKLRGDNPELYGPNGLKENKIKYRKFDYYAINNCVDDKYRTDTNQKIYYLYHFDSNVRKAGKETYDFEIVSDYIRLVEVIQKGRQFDIAHLGIYIECNPTSNLLISKLDRYEKHPIIKFYNSELFHGQDKMCAQINVSINTDDQGVFDTSLENEYALMAYALENYRVKNNYLYSSSDVYKWIDAIRKMGLQQRFK